MTDPRLDPAASDRAEAALPSRYGAFRIAVYRLPATDAEVVALVHGDVRTWSPVLVRLHSECLTGEALGSLRCDCGDQLASALEQIGRADRGVLLYLRHEGRGIGLFDKIRAYSLQDGGLDTVDANVALGLPIDARDWASASAVLRRLGVRRVRVLTNNPAKVDALRQLGIEVVERVALETAPNPISLPYLRTKQRRMGHLLEAIDRAAPLGPASALERVTVHWAQTIDGRIASRSGDARWVSGDASLRFAHELRATHDAVLVGVGTVLKDDPLLTTRLVDGPSPVRVVVDSTLRTPPDARTIADRHARTIVATTDAAPAIRGERLRSAGAEVVRVRRDERGDVDLRALFERLRGDGLRSLLVEGGRGVITSVLRDHLVDRFLVCIAPKVLGQGVEAVGDLGIDRLRDAITFRSARFVACGSDIIFDGVPAAAAAAQQLRESA